VDEQDSWHFAAAKIQHTHSGAIDPDILQSHFNDGKALAAKNFAVKQELFRLADAELLYHPGNFPIALEYHV
jgi:hypothetical protein